MTLMEYIKCKLGFKRMFARHVRYMVLKGRLVSRRGQSLLDLGHLWVPEMQVK